MEVTGYELSRNWFDWAFENSEKISPAHAALYFYIIEHCNRLGWKDNFGLPTTMAMEAVGIRSYNTYIKVLNELIGWGFITMVQKSKNQYTANIVALSKFNKAPNKAFDKAIIKQTSKQLRSTDCIDKPVNNETNKPLNKVKPSASYEKKEVDLFYKACIPIWFKHRQGWRLTTKDGKGLKMLIEEISSRQKEIGEIPNPQNTAALLDLILSSLEGDFYKTASPHVLYGQFNTIYQKLKNKRNGTANHTHNTRAEEYANSPFR